MNRWAPVQKKPEEFENGGFTLKRIRRFPSTLRRSLKMGKGYYGEIRNATITDHSWFVFEENSGREISWLSWPHCFQKSSFSKSAGVSKFLQLEERFRKAPFSWRISVHATLNFRNKSCVFKFLRVSVNRAWVYRIWLPSDINFQRGFLRLRKFWVFQSTSDVLELKLSLSSR